MMLHLEGSDSLWSLKIKKFLGHQSSPPRVNCLRMIGRSGCAPSLFSLIVCKHVLVIANPPSLLFLYDLRL